MHTASRILTTAILAALSTGALAAGPAERALGHLRANGAIAKAAPGDAFIAKSVTIDADGSSHVRFNRTHQGLPMIGGDLVVHQDRNGGFRAPSMGLKSPAKVDIRERLSAEDAFVIAGVDFGQFDGIGTSRKVVFARNATPALAWDVVLHGTRGGDPVVMHYFIDAHSGRILDRENEFHTAKPGGGGGGSTTPATGIGRTYAYGDVILNIAGSGSSYSLTDTTRGGGATYDANNVSYTTAARRAVLFTSTTTTFGNNLLSNRATSAADAHFGVAATWDYFKNIHGRNGIFNNGVGAKSYVHVGNNWGNAAWYQNAMYYGDASGGYLPFTAIDIAGHEMSHGVTQATSGLAYSGDAGGLNEATSDIFGTMVEYAAANGNDPGDYLIGEGIYPDSTSALRYMYDPNSDGNYSYDCYPAAGFGGVDPHYSSGPANHFYYLLAEGTSPAGGPTSNTCIAGNAKNATGNGSLAGIGRAKAEKIWYRALDVYFTSGTTYPQARTATLNAAADLYGAASPERAAVAAAWTAINVN
ncbi:MAG TPA: M4 family metallopeptidase [Thermomonas sp.]|nr:M4 family metallopeptidase [Thermomonas sp.]